jgi:4-oxalocrotonate tautomerase
MLKANRSRKDRNMPHIIVKLLPGRSEEQKTALAGELAKAAVAVLGCAETSVSVGFEEVSIEDWPEKVFRPDILDKPATIYKKPGYNPF